MNDVFQKRNVRLHAAYPELAQRAIHALQRGIKGLCAHRQLNQQRIVKRRDHRTAVAHATVEPHAKTAGTAIRQNAAVVGLEFIFRVLRRDAALHGVTIARNVFLRGNANFLAVHRLAVGDENLRTHQIQAGDDFRDRVFHLNARVHLDEEPFLRVLIVKKFHRAGVVVFDFATEFHRRLTQLRAHVAIQFHTRRDLDDFLMAALHGAIALVQMNDLAVLIAENLHLDVLRAGNIAFEEYRRITERPTRFALRFVEQIREVARLVDDAHAATATAKRRLDDEGKPNLLRHLQGFSAIFDGVFCARQHRHVHFLCERTRGSLVAHVLQQIDARPDENNSRLLARLRKRSIF